MSLKDKELAECIGVGARQARMSLMLTQEDAAERIGVSAEFYARIERGNSLPSVPTFVKIATALGVSLDVLVGFGTPSQEPEPADPPTLVPDPGDGPEIRRIVRMLRRARSNSRHLVVLVLKQMEGLESAILAESANSARRDGDFED